VICELLHRFGEISRPFAPESHRDVPSHRRQERPEVLLEIPSLVFPDKLQEDLLRDVVHQSRPRREFQGHAFYEGVVREEQLRCARIGAVHGSF
jgi:hypothetical protein